MFGQPVRIKSHPIWPVPQLGNPLCSRPRDSFSLCWLKSSSSGRFLSSSVVTEWSLGQTSGPWQTFSWPFWGCPSWVLRLRSLPIRCPYRWFHAYCFQSFQVITLPVKWFPCYWLQHSPKACSIYLQVWTAGQVFLSSDSVPLALQTCLYTLRPKCFYFSYVTHFQNESDWYYFVKFWWFSDEDAENIFFLYLFDKGHTSVGITLQ